MPIDIVTDLPLDEDQKRRLLRMVRGNGHVDHEGFFRNAQGDRCEAKAIRFLKEIAPGVHGGETKIHSVDGLVFEKSPFLYLEEPSGRLTGWTHAREWTKSSWHYGVIFQDDKGDAWFCGRNEANGEKIGSDDPILRRVSLETPLCLREENGALGESLPAEGEFWLTEGDPAIVTLIPWWSGFAGEPRPDWPGSEEAVAEERAILAQLKARIAALDPAPSP